MALTARIEDLERRLWGERAPDESAGTLAERLAALERTLAAAEARVEGWGDLAAEIEAAEPLLEDARAGRLLSTAAKREVLLSARDSLAPTADQLEKVGRLAPPVLDAETFREVPAMRASLGALEPRQQRLQADAAEVVAQVEALLGRYEEAMLSVSAVFVEAAEKRR